MITDKLDDLYEELLKKQKSLKYNKSALSKEEQREYDRLEDQLYCISSYQEGHKEWYEAVAKYAKELGLKKVYDIGCCYGYQSEEFIKLGLQYVGIEICRYMKDNAYNLGNQNVEYIFKKYPCEIHPEKDSIAISHLCIGFLINTEEELKTLYDQFDNVLIDTSCGGKLDRLYKRKSENFNKKYGNYILYGKE